MGCSRRHFFKSEPRLEQYLQYTDHSRHLGEALAHRQHKIFLDRSADVEVYRARRGQELKRGSIDTFDRRTYHTAPPSLRRTTLLNERVRHERRDSSHDSEVRFAAPSAPLRACACIARPWRTARCPSRGRAPFMVIQRPWQLVSAGAWEGPRIFQGVTGSGAYLVSAH